MSKSYSRSSKWKICNGIGHCQDGTSEMPPRKYCIEAVPHVCGTLFNREHDWQSCMYYAGEGFRTCIDWEEKP